MDGEGGQTFFVHVFLISYLYFHTFFKHFIFLRKVFFFFKDVSLGLTL